MIGLSNYRGGFMELIHISKEEFEDIKHNIDTDLTWAYPDKNYMYQVRESNKIIALIAFKNSLSECKNKIFIDNFYVFEKRKGSGKRILAYLMDQYSEIELFPTKESRKFWYNLDFLSTDESGDNYIWKR